MTTRKLKCPSTPKDDQAALKALKRRAGELGFCSVNDALDALAAQQN